MADVTKIEWTDATWNVINGCSLASPGCTNCYAMRLAATRLKHHPSRAGLAKIVNGNPVWTGETRFNEAVLQDPLRWRRPRRIFVCAHGDLFHESVPDEWIDRVFAVMALAPQHQFQVLTKRPERMRRYLTDQGVRDEICSRALAMPASEGFCRSWPLPNVWLGVSVEDQRRAEERIPDLLLTPAAIRWISAEPLLGPVDLTRISTFRFRGAEVLNALTGELSGMFGDYCATRLRLDWVVAGGESGPGARPMPYGAAQSLRDQCAGAGVAFLFKQHGNWLHVEGGEGGRELHWMDKTRAGRELDGALHDEFPA